MIDPSGVGSLKIRPYSSRGCVSDSLVDTIEVVCVDSELGLKEAGQVIAVAESIYLRKARQAGRLDQQEDRATLAYSARPSLRS